MKTITKKEAENKLGKSLDFHSTYIEKGNELFFVENPIGIIIYGRLTSGETEGGIETSLKNYNETMEWSKANDISPKDLMNDSSLLELYPKIQF